MVVKIYVDTCVLISYYYEQGTQKYTDVINCFEFINKNPSRISIVTSDFTLTEFVKAAIKNPLKIARDTVFEDISSITRRNKIGKIYPCDLIDGEGSKSDYHLCDFFVDLQEQLLDSNAHLADTIHYQIMFNNNIKRVLTLNINDFKNFPKIIAIHPSKINEYFLDEIKPPVSSFIVNKSTVIFPGKAEFTDTSTNTPTSWLWNFGDGSTPVTSQNPSHKYTKRGTFNVSLTTTNLAGSHTTSAVIRIIGYQ